MWNRQADIKALEQVQCRAARYVYNDYTSGTPGCVTDRMGKPLTLGKTQDFQTLAAVQKPSWFS